MNAYRFLDAMYRGASWVQPVDCGTCPVTLACAIDQGGNGMTFACCGSTGFETFDAAGKPLLLVIDCTRHRFLGHDDPLHPEGRTMCPLCSGEIIDAVMLKLTDPCMWVPTIYAKVPVETRLDVWCRASLAALERKERKKRR